MIDAAPTGSGHETKSALVFETNADRAERDKEITD
jgi:hypothetical protein